MNQTFFLNFEPIACLFQLENVQVDAELQVETNIATAAEFLEACPFVRFSPGKNSCFPWASLTDGTRHETSKKSSGC